MLDNISRRPASPIMDAPVDGTTCIHQLPDLDGTRQQALNFVNFLVVVAVWIVDGYIWSTRKIIYHS